MSDRAISDLCPALQIIAREWLAQCAAQGLKAALIVTWRSGADQDKDHAEGLSCATSGQSPHNLCAADGSPASAAFDFGVFESNGAYVTDGKDPRYAQAAGIGKSLGLIWGGDFHDFPDFDHLELANWKLTTA